MKKPEIEATGTYKNFKYVVLFQNLGHRCGYVGIPKGHKLYEVYYDDIPVDCHGGLTYSDFDDILGQEDLWWIGFDCAHLNDGVDVESLVKYYGTELTAEMLYTLNYRVEGHVWTKDECVEECKKIIDQIIEEDKDMTDYKEILDNLIKVKEGAIVEARKLFEQYEKAFVSVTNNLDDYEAKIIKPKYEFEFSIRKEIHVYNGLKKFADAVGKEIEIIHRDDEDYSFEAFFYYNDYKVFQIGRNEAGCTE